MIQPEELVGAEWAEWYRLTPIRQQSLQPMCRTIPIIKPIPVHVIAEQGTRLVREEKHGPVMNSNLQPNANRKLSEFSRR
jgi:hypothetical protein